MRSQLLLAAALCLSVNAASAQNLLIRGGEVHTGTDAGVLDNADILIEDGTISAIGTNLTAPSGTETLNAGGKPVTAALFAGVSAIGLAEVEAELDSVDNRLADLHDTPMRPEFDVTPAYNPYSTVVPVTRVEGFGFTLLGASASDSIIAGQGQLVRLDGGFASFAGDKVLFITIGGGSADKAGASRAAQWMVLEHAMAEAKRPSRQGEPALLTRQGRETLKAYARDGTVVFAVDRASDILQTLDFAQRHGFNAVIAGGAEAWMVANALADADVPVLLDPLANLPNSFDSVGSRLDNAALLHAAGVDVGFSGAETHNTRKNRQMAGNAVANGLPWEAGLAGLTSVPARLFGMSGGELSAGMAGDVVIWSGDPLEVTSAADAVVLSGKVDSMTSRQTRLRDRYLPRQSDLPRAYIKP